MTTASVVARSGGRARNGDYEIEYEVFGDPSDPVVLFVSGLGSQMLAYRPAFCERVVAAGFCAVRFDNRDVGLSTKTPGAPLMSYRRKKYSPLSEQYKSSMLFLRYRRGFHATQHG